MLQLRVHVPGPLAGAVLADLRDDPAVSAIGVVRSGSDPAGR